MTTLVCMCVVHIVCISGSGFNSGEPQGSLYGWEDLCQCVTSWQSVSVLLRGFLDCFVLNLVVSPWRSRKWCPEHFLQEGHNTDWRPASSRNGNTMLFDCVMRKQTIMLRIGSSVLLLQTHKDLHFVHVRQGGLYWVATTTTVDSSPFTIIEFLNRCLCFCTFCQSLRPALLSSSRNNPETNRDRCAYVVCIFSSIVPQIPPKDPARAWKIQLHVIDFWSGDPAMYVCLCVSGWQLWWRITVAVCQRSQCRWTLPSSTSCWTRWWWVDLSGQHQDVMTGRTWGDDSYI